jgi:hypothetical protein
VSSGIGQGKSFPVGSSATGRPAIKDSSAVEVTGKDCWPLATDAYSKNANQIPVSRVMRLIAHIFAAIAGGGN